MVPFLLGAGDDELAVGEGELLSVDPPRHRILGLDLAGIEARLNQAAPLVAPQRVAREHQGDAQAPMRLSRGREAK